MAMQTEGRRLALRPSLCPRIFVVGWLVGWMVNESVNSRYKTYKEIAGLDTTREGYQLDTPRSNLSVHQKI